MEMAGIVCYTGAKIIQNARKIVERIGLFKKLFVKLNFLLCIFFKAEH